METTRMKVPEGVPDGKDAIEHHGWYDVVDGHLRALPQHVAELVQRGFKIAKDEVKKFEQ